MNKMIRCYNMYFFLRIKINSSNKNVYLTQKFYTPFIMKLVTYVMSRTFPCIKNSFDKCSLGNIETVDQEYRGAKNTRHVCSKNIFSRSTTHLLSESYS